jgi:hypothetical protein
VNRLGGNGDAVRQSLDDRGGPAAILAHVRVGMLLVLSLSAGCLSANEEALRRAHVEFPSCPADRMKIAARPELSDATYDVDACGHVARYTCSRPSGYPLTCAREPDPQVSPP